ncbi:MAG TPA: MFS transporter [Methanophagales archaeon]|nr:MFS transporter [Methanophagales archaeon]
MKTIKNTVLKLLPLSASHGLMHILATALPALSLLVKDEFQLTNTTVGVLSFAFAAAIGFGGIPSGMLSDRFDGIKLISIGFFSTALLSAFLLCTRNFLSIALIFIAIGFFLSLYHPSALSYIAKSFRDTRGKAYGVHEIGASIGIAIAPLIAGFICLYYGWRFVYPVLAFPAIILALLLIRLQSNRKWARKKQISEVQSNANDLKVFLRQITRTSSIRKIYITECIFGFVFVGALTFVPVFLDEAKGLGPALAITVTCVFTAGGAIGKVIGGHFSDLIGERKVMTIGFFLTTPLFFILPLLPLSWAILTLALAGTIFPTVLSAIITAVGREIEPSRAGIAFGFLLLAGFGFGSISPLILGLVSDSLGISAVFYPIVIAILIGGILNST